MKNSLRPAALGVALSICAPAYALDLSAMNDSERAHFGDAVRAYLMENPEVIIEAVEVLEQRQQEAEGNMDRALVDANRDAIFNDGFSHVGGNPEGDITLVEFVDYRCGFCRRAHDEVQQLIKSDGNIRFITKEFPILGEDSLASSRFAIAVLLEAGDDAYAAAAERLIRFKAPVTEPNLREIAADLDLDGDAILARMETDEVTRRIEETRALAQRLNINGTPTFVLETELLRGYMPFEGMQQVVESLRADAG